MKNAYPLKLTFKLIALAPRVSVRDANNHEIFYIEQKVFALKEAIKVFNNEKDKTLLYTIKTDQIIDFGARYYITTADGKKQIGSVMQEGVRSLFRASYIILDTNDRVLYTVTQSNPWISLFDSVINIIPFADLATGFILFPAYEVVEKTKKDPLLLMKKQLSLFESVFSISNVKPDIADGQELLLLLSLLMIVQLEQNRG